MGVLPWKRIFGSKHDTFFSDWKFVTLTCLILTPGVFAFFSMVQTDVLQPARQGVTGHLVYHAKNPPIPLSAFPECTTTLICRLVLHTVPLTLSVKIVKQESCEY